MTLTLSQQSSLVQKVIAKFKYELEVAMENDTIEEILDMYGIILEDNSFPVFKKQHKILVLGALAGNVNDFKIAAKRMGLNPNQIEFIYDYDELKHINVAKFEYSNTYSDIICGPNPHKQKGMGDTPSFLSLMKNNQEKYPRVIDAWANGVLKLSINSFKESIRKTRLIEANYC